MTVGLLFLLDVDNTLLNNDRAKEALNEKIRALVPEKSASRFWKIYEEVRDRRGFVAYPSVVNRFRAEHRGATFNDAVESAVIDFPYEEFLYPSALSVIARLRELGKPVILSDGDSSYQWNKIARSGLRTAVNNNVVVTPHKEQHLRDIEQLYPADRYVVIDDKAALLAEMKVQLRGRVVTVHVRQGHYADDPAPLVPDVSVATIGDVLALPAETFTTGVRL